MRFICGATLLACSAIGTVGASDGSVDTDPNKVPALEQSEQCNDAMVNAAMPIWPKDALRSGTSGWAIVRYDLDGSGRVQNAEVVASAPQQVFDKAALHSIKGSKFTHGFVKAGCKMAFVYSLKSSN